MKKNYTLNSLFTALLFSTLAVAQVPIDWTRSYNGPADNTDEAAEMYLDASDNVYVTGTSFGTSGTFDIVTIKYNSAGTQQWAVTYNGTANDNDGSYGVTADASGNVYVVGKTRTQAALDDIVTIKYNSSGVQQWAQTYNGAGNSIDEGFDVQVDGSGNVYVTGYVTAANNYFDMVTIKYNSAGTQQWATTFNGSGNGSDQGDALVVDASGNVYVNGSGNATQNGTLSDVSTIKYNSAGVQQWAMHYDGNNDNDYGRGIIMDAAGDIVVIGQSFMTGNWFDYITIKYNPAGTQQWATRYNNGSNRFEEPMDLVSDPNNNIYVTGISQATGNNSAPTDIATLKYNSTGTQQWVARYNGTASSDDKGFSIALDDTLNVYVGGYTQLSTSNRNYITIKYNNSGTPKWDVSYDGAGNGLDQITDIAVSSIDASVFVTGFADVVTGSNVNNNYVTIKYATNSIGFIEFGNVVTEMILFPNPSNGNSTITINADGLNANTDITIGIYDVTGKLIFTGNDFTFSNNKANFDLSKASLQAGAYIVNVTGADGKLNGVGKLIVQ